MSNPVKQVPDWCDAVSPECPLDGTVLAYYPSMGWNAFFAGVFGVACALQLILGIRYKTWTYMIALMLGTFGECIGYVGRIMLHNNPYDSLGFQIQIIALIVAPAFLAAGIYLVLKHVVIGFGDGWSRLKPVWYTRLFIACDISSILLQFTGGAVAATGSDGSAMTTGTNIMIAGIVWQVIVLVIFALFVLDYAVRTMHRRDQVSSEGLRLMGDRKFKFFVCATIIAYLGILVRCIYRIPELAEGWGGKMMRDEASFIGLEGVMIVITVIAQTVFHPGFCFPALASTFAKKKAMKNQQRQKNLSDSDVELADRPSLPQRGYHADHTYRQEQQPYRSQRNQRGYA